MTEHQHQRQHEHESRTCHELLASLSEYVDGTLDESLCAQVEKHLAECERCRIVIDTLRKTVELYHTLPAAPPVPDDVRMRLFARLHLEDFLVERKQAQ
jgi:anti-sigma factor (TIGR02949 family)